MKMIKAIVRPEKCDEVLNELCEAGFRATTRYSYIVFHRCSWSGKK